MPAVEGVVVHRLAVLYLVAGRTGHVPFLFVDCVCWVPSTPREGYFYGRLDEVAGPAKRSGDSSDFMVRSAMRSDFVFRTPNMRSMLLAGNRAYVLRMSVRNRAAAAAEQPNRARCRREAGVRPTASCQIRTVRRSVGH
jgi:hypothetical protein